jgi:hypothetical protein
MVGFDPYLSVGGSGTAVSENSPACLSRLDGRWGVSWLDQHQDHHGRDVLYALSICRIPVTHYGQGSYATQSGSRSQNLQSATANPARLPHAPPVLIQEELSMGEFIRELWSFMKVRKKFWLLPIIICLLLLGGLIVFTSGSAVAPFIYTLF